MANFTGEEIFLFIFFNSKDLRTYIFCNIVVASKYQPFCIYEKKIDTVCTAKITMTIELTVSN
jgi:hypothetical protein